MPSGEGAVMSVKTPHKDFERLNRKWERCRDVFAGQDAMRARCVEKGIKINSTITALEAYIPALKDQTPDDYKGYIIRAPFYNASWRTLAGLNGMLFRKPMKVEAPEALKPMLEDVTLMRCSLQTFAQQVSSEALGIGRVGILVDYPTVEGENLTKADAAKLNLRPTMTMFRAEDIINWKTRRIANRVLLSQVVLAEVEPLPGSDEFEEKSELRYRVLDLDSSDQYRVRIFRVTSDGKDEQVGGELLPKLKGQRLPYIPFIILGADGVQYDCDEPPLIDLVDMNIAHWRVTADYEHGCHFAGLPTPVVSGYQPPKEGEKLYIGSASAWLFPDPNARASYLEFTGSGLTPLKENLADKEQRMAVLGARMLEAMKSGVEAAETAGIHRIGEQSVLANVAQSVSMGLTIALRWFTEWASLAPEGVLIELNRDFLPTAMTPEELTAQVSAWQMGAISKQQLFDNLKGGEVISPSATFEEEEARIIAQAPSAPPDPEPGEGE